MYCRGRTDSEFEVGGERSFGPFVGPSKILYADYTTLQVVLSTNEKKISDKN
jgi:hypothetical protein